MVSLRTALDALSSLFIFFYLLRNITDYIYSFLLFDFYLLRRPPDVRETGLPEAKAQPPL